ncbi:MAG: hypothetical protein DLM68_02955 [Hyphomicrobiales bacterium]|nr:MAG: hypothetical protein DLM68_02955 [Hyphomicrobiales bacterium]
MHYLLAVAQLRSKISDTNQGEEIGPFRLIQKDWDAFRSDADFEFNFLSSDINIWRMQCHVVPLVVYRAEQRLFNKLNRTPSAVELYQEQWPQSQQATLVNDLRDALASTETLLLPAAKAFFGDDIPVVVTLILQSLHKILHQVLSILRGYPVATKGNNLRTKFWTTLGRLDSRFISKSLL